MSNPNDESGAPESQSKPQPSVTHYADTSGSKVSTLHIRDIDLKETFVQKAAANATKIGLEYTPEVMIFGYLCFLDGIITAGTTFDQIKLLVEASKAQQKLN